MARDYMRIHPDFSSSSFNVSGQWSGLETELLRLSVAYYSLKSILDSNYLKSKGISKVAEERWHRNHSHRPPGLAVSLKPFAG
jgi:hypothetical protein